VANLKLVKTNLDRFSDGRITTFVKKV